MNTVFVILAGAWLVVACVACGVIGLALLFGAPWRRVVKVSATGDTARWRQPIRIEWTPGPLKVVGPVDDSWRNPQRIHALEWPSDKARFIAAMERMIEEANRCDNRLGLRDSGIEEERA